MQILAKHIESGAEFEVQILRMNTPVGKRAVIVTPCGEKLVPTEELFKNCVLYCDGVESHEILSRLARVAL